MRRIPLMLAVAGGLALAGCQTEPPYTIQAPTAPGPASQPSLPPGPPPLAGTAGPLAQAGVGHYMDGLEADLRTRLRGYRVARRGDVILLEFPNDGLFAGMTISAPGTALLATVAKVLAHYDRTRLVVFGHTDTSGSMASNLDVSQRRAELVRDALAAGGVAEGRSEAHGLGPTSLRVATGQGVAEPRNRRIEIRVMPNPD